MEIYKKRLIKTVYNSYLVTSDIEGATVIFDGEEVGTIQNGSFTFRIPQKTDLSDSHTISIKENTGTLYQKPTDYVLSTDYTEENRLQISNLKNDIIDFSSYVTSTKTTYTQSYPTQVTVENITQEINLNTVQTPNTTTVPVTGELDINANHTTNVVEGFVEITQDESNNKINLYYSQAAGVQTQFTVNSNIEGASVAISYITSTSNMKTGNIVDGTCTINYWQDEWEEGQMQAAITGDSSLLTPTQETYTFENLTEDPVTFPGVGGTFNISEYWNIISTFGQTTYSYPSTSSIGPTHTITLNEVPYTESGVTKSYSPTQLNLTAVTAVQDSSIQITQEESGKTLDLPYHQNAMALHTYTVYSDIEGATVQFGNSHTATVTDGQAVLQLYDNEAQASFNVSISGGTLVTKETEYVFENVSVTGTIPAEGGSLPVNATSHKVEYTPSYPNSATINIDGTITMNTVITDKQTELSYYPSSCYRPENRKEDAVSQLFEITQTESGLTQTVMAYQEAGTRYSYTVYSNCEGATVDFGGYGEETISNGRCTLYLWNNRAPSSINVTFPNGSGLDPDPSTYTFNISQSSLSFGENGGTQYLTISSYRTDYSYNSPSGTVNRNSSTTLNAYQSGKNTNLNYSASESLSWITTSGNAVTASANSNYSSRSGTITYSQAESGKTDTVNVSQEAKTLYSYTINSNCTGGTVYFNNSSKGTIPSSGTLSFTDTASSGTVRISGGVPSNYTNYGDWYDGSTSYEYSTGSYSTFVSFNSSTNESHTTVNHTAAADSDTVYCYAYRYATRRRRAYWNTYRDYTTYTYSAPSSKTIYGNSSAITMNYTSSSNSGTEDGGTEYGSWSDYDTVYDNISLSVTGPNYGSTAASDAYTASYSIGTATGSGRNRRFPITVKTTANNSLASSSTAWIDFGYESTYTKVLINKAAADIEYVFSTSGSWSKYAEARASSPDAYSSTNACSGLRIISYKKVGSTYTRLSWSKTGSTTGGALNLWATSDGSGSSTGHSVKMTFSENPTVSATNNSTRTGTIRIVQSESGKELTITGYQYNYVLNMSTGGATTTDLNLTFDTSAGNHGTPVYIACQSGSGYSSTWPKWSASWSGGSWAHLNNGGTSATGSNGDALYVTTEANSGSQRTGKVNVGISGKSGTYATINVTQRGVSGVYGFTLKFTNSSTIDRAWVVTTSSVTNLSGTILYPSISGLAAYNGGTFVNAVVSSISGSTTSPFSSGSTGTKTFKLWRANSNPGTYTSVATFSVANGGTYTYSGS